MASEELQTAKETPTTLGKPLNQGLAFFDICQGPAEICVFLAESKDASFVGETFSLNCF